MCTSICDKPCSPQCVPYTPTTEEVRRRYMFGCWQEYEDTSGDYKAEFDRWLAEVNAQAWQDGYESVTITTVANPYRQGEEQ